MYPYLYWGIYSTIMYVTYAVVMESGCEAAFTTVVVHYISSAIKICFVAVVRSYQQQVSENVKGVTRNRAYDLM